MQEVIEFKEKINTLLDLGKYQEVLLELDKQVELFNNQDDQNIFLLAEIAGSYVSLGSESYNIETVEKGLNIFNEHRDIIETVASEDSIEYCLGNAFHAIYKIKSQDIESYFPTPDNVKDSLFDAKQSYLKAFKNIDLEQLNSYSVQVLTNLGNNLNHSGRIVEALQMFDVVLRFNSEFPQAVVSKADGLRYMMQTSNCSITISLIAEMYRLFSLASQSEIHVKEINESIKVGLNKSSEFLIKNDVDLDSLGSEFEENHKEYLNHPEEVKFYLDNFLSLSEHSLYCNCNGAKIDDLVIGYSGFATLDKRIVQLELLNNRLKSEFDLARKLCFDYCSIESSDYVHYENFVPGILNGAGYEKLRTSFRLCFGILDKIAEGICYLFDLKVGEKENIYFESFWGYKNNAKRWTKINNFKNIHLTALFSIACDLNKKNGEFGFYKVWRNRLEHGLFSITDTDYSTSTWEDEQFRHNTSVSDFEIRAKHLLQLVRASIFSFVFCARHELITKE